MKIIMKKDISEKEILRVHDYIRNVNCDVCIHKENNQYILGITGNVKNIDSMKLSSDQYIDSIVEIKTPYKRASKEFKYQNTVVSVNNYEIGGKNLAIIAGPCAVESREQIIRIAKDVKASGANFLRGGAFKPRTSPYDFQGLKEEGLKFLVEAKKLTGLPIVTEVMTPSQVDLVVQYADVLQVGSRNMQNFDLLREVGKSNKPVLLKRGLCSTVEELIMSAEYIMSEGNEKVILCERGIRTFESYTRNTLDLSAVLAVKKLTHLPIIVDPSHASGKAWMIESLAKAAIAVGADGIMVEVHHDPENAKSDGEQSIKPDSFRSLVDSVNEIAKMQSKVV